MGRTISVRWRPICASFMCLCITSLTLYLTFRGSNDNATKEIVNDIEMNGGYKFTFDDAHIVQGALFKSVRELNISQQLAPIPKVVNIWSKAAIGLYLWEHIFDGKFESRSNMFSFGQMEINGIIFRFHTGPGLTLTSVATDNEDSNILLVLNGREPSKISVARDWLDLVNTSPNIANAGVVLLGNEECNNTWLEEYVTTRQHHQTVQFVFVVYDSLEVDEDRFFQWPLGVATYRSFPAPTDLDVESPRRYRCNFLATIYPNSTREILLQVLQHADTDESCFVKTRAQWVLVETKESMSDYVDVLRQSDLTLNPVGRNVECYRIYEAMSLGSVPVIEDRSTSVTCSGSMHNDTHDKTLRLLRRYDAPVIYVTDWRQVSSLLDTERQMSLKDIVARRKRVVNWYKRFRRKMRETLVNVVDKQFFNKISSEGMGYLV